MEVTASERGLIRLFAVDLPPEEIRAFNTRHFDDDGDQTSWPLYDALGPTYLDEDFIEYFDVDDLEELGLAGYMTEGLGIAEADIRQDTARLSSLDGHVLIVFSSAFGGLPVTLTPRAPLRWIGTYAEESAPVQFKPLRAQAAKGPISGSQGATSPANPHLTLIVALLALPVMALILGAILWGVLK